MSLIPSFCGSNRRSNVFAPFSLDVWDPFEGLPFSSALSRSGSVSKASAFAGVHIVWKETQEAHVFQADVSGLKGEIKVVVEDNNDAFQINGERSIEKEEQNDKWHHVEWSSGKFLYRFRLPGNAKVEQIKASMENEVLTVIVPKEEVTKPEIKAIDISIRSTDQGSFHHKRKCSGRGENGGMKCSSSNRKCSVKRSIKVPAISNKLAYIPPNEYSWRKYGQKPIKGSPHPRNQRTFHPEKIAPSGSKGILFQSSGREISKNTTLDLSQKVEKGLNVHI